MRVPFLALAVALLVFLLGPSYEKKPDVLTLPGLDSAVSVTTDELGIPHIHARTLRDALRVEGYLHARDRFFQMDVQRRRADGTLMELLGNKALTDDLSIRFLGLREAARREAAALSPSHRALVEAYTEGVNHWLATNPLPEEYADLELSQVRPWTLEDGFVFAKIFALLFDNRFFEIDDSLTLNAYRQAGDEGGFEGTSLFFEDLARVAPMDPELPATVPDAGGDPPFLPLPNSLQAKALHADPAARAPRSGRSLSTLRSQTAAGSNYYAVTSSRSLQGAPIIAATNDLESTIPTPGYEIHVSVEADPLLGKVNVAGVSSPGLGLFFVTARTEHLAWGAPGSFFDVFDVFADRLIRGDPNCRDEAGHVVSLCISSEGMLHPVQLREERYLVNQVGDGVFDNLLDVTESVSQFPPLFGLAVKVPTVPFRSFGPISFVEDSSILEGEGPGETVVWTIQWTGQHAVQPLRGVLAALDARDVFEFGRAARLLGQPSHYFAADTQGNLAYFPSQEVPLRADLETGRVEGDGPMFLRDGSGPSNWIRDPKRSQGQTLPFRVIPFEEMPQIVNPPTGLLVNTNSDPAGTELDNDLLNQRRTSNPRAIYYLGFSVILGELRAGRATRLLKSRIDAEKPVSVEDMKSFEANTQQLDAELMTPFLLEAWENALRPGAPPELAAFASNLGIDEAVSRLAAWDFSTPTGIPQGYDASDEDGIRDPDVSPDEARHSVSATLYNVWRGRLIENAVKSPLTELGLNPDSSPPLFGFGERALRAVHHLLSRDPFTGIGASGINFFPEPAHLPAADRRDIVLLTSLEETLDALAGRTFALAFGGSTNQDDYRWGRLHRIRLVHPMGGERSIPPAAGFEDLSAGLPGIARDGGFETLNRGSSSSRAVRPTSANQLVFELGSVWRWVMSPGHPDARRESILALSNLAGGASGDVNSEFYASRLGKWLTVDYDPVRTNRASVRRVARYTEIFRPVARPEPPPPTLPKGKLTLCHKTGAGRGLTIRVGAPAAPAHLAHGDVLGGCP